MKYKYKCLHLLMLCAVIVSLLPIKNVAAQTPQSVVISELQTGGLTSTGAENGKMEFVELRNLGDQSVNVTDWHVEYLSATHTGSGPPTRVLATLSGSIAPQGYVLLSYQDYLPQADMYFGQGGTALGGLLARSGGHVRLTSGAGETMDLVAWGTGTKIGTWYRAPELLPGTSVQRQVGDQQLFTAPTSQTTPQGGGLLQTPSNTCSGIVISELLPNPAGADTGQEFIELFNPTDQPVGLKGCSLRLGDAGKTYNLPDISLAASAYLALYDNVTGLTLPNATAITVWLLTATDEIGVTYPNDMSDNVAWAYLDGSWQATATPTPNAPNSKPLQPTISDPEEVSKTVVVPVSCPAGKERNPETNRCRTIIVASPAPTCKAGQERNPETGRCKTVAGATSTPCKENQVRNPETNRCKTVATAAASVKACPAGQNRNTETNRCRKDTSTTNKMAKVADVTTKQPVSSLRLWILGIIGVGALGYAAYEWRSEVFIGCNRLLQRYKGKK